MTVYSLSHDKSMCYVWTPSRKQQFLPMPLIEDIQAASSLTIVCWKLKFHLFQQSYFEIIL